MRTIGVKEIEDIALGASLLGSGGGGDPYIGKLMAIGAIQEKGPVTLLDPDEIADGAFVMPIAMMGAPTVLAEKGVGKNEYQTLYDMVSSFFGRKIDVLMPMEAGGVNSMLPFAAAARLGLPLVDADGMGRAFPELQAVHINHHRELAPEARRVLAACVAAGVPVLVQTVLLRGVNDDAAALEKLFRECLGLGLTPYYLFQLDLAPGTAHFRVPLKRGLALYRELRDRLGGDCPAYAVDLPGGGGKIRLNENSIAGEGEEPGGPVYYLKGPDGSLWAYPRS